MSDTPERWNTMIPKYELRYSDCEFEVRAKPGGKGFIFNGYAAVFDTLSQDLGGFVEDVRAGAFKKTIQESDVRALFNHDSNIVLGRNRAGTLRMNEDSTGLNYEVDAPDTQAARDLVVSMERKDITQSSFGFTAVRDDWSFTPSDYPLRSLVEVRLYDVSPVTFPAYEEASSGVAKRSLAKHLGIAPESMEGLDLRALLKGEEVTLPTTSQDADESDEPVEDHSPDYDALRRLIDSKGLPEDIASQL